MTKFIKRFNTAPYTLHANALNPESLIIQQACMLLREDIYDIPAIADACNMPYSSFRLLFQKQLGCSPNTYRIRSCIERAQALLSESWSLQDIAAELGYNDAFRLSKQFKSIVGMSPRAWKQQLGA